MTIAVVGIGLIGGSLAITLRENGFADWIIGVDASSEHERMALRRAIVDEVLPLDRAIERADVVVLSTPVNTMKTLLPDLLDRLDDQTVVMDVGSTKGELLAAVRSHPRRGRFVATHPMAGTEYSGPTAAIPNLFDHKCTVICERERSADDALRIVEALYASIPMRVVYLQPEEHDVHTAYVSHISHISSFALALTVLEKEKDEKRIFQLASGGFSSTVRLAKSSPDMWIPICEQNRENVLDVLDEHINTLAQFRTLLIKKDFEKFKEKINAANAIRKVLEG